MNVNIAKFNKLYDKINLYLKRRTKLVMNPNMEYSFKSSHKEVINIDTTNDGTDWEISNELEIFIDKLLKRDDLTDENRILYICEKICQEYLYDDNILSYLKRDESGVFSLPDEYGRVVDEKWQEERSKHNRRVCYEISRYLCCSLMKVFEKKSKYNIGVFYDEDVTHYFVGLSSEDYSLIIDLDDYEQMKDMTRVKMGLTLDGIKILEDLNGKFSDALNKFNNGKEKHAVLKVNKDIEKNVNERDRSKANEEPEDIIYFKKCLQIAKEEYNLDPQGIYELMKEIIDISMTKENRRKIWKVTCETNNYLIYRRCLIVIVEEKKYLIDVVKCEIREFDEREYDNFKSEYRKYGDRRREWNEEPYHGG